MDSTTSGHIATDRDSHKPYAETHYDEDLSHLTGHHENGLFWNCTFKDLRGLTLKDSVLKRSKFTTDKVEEAVGFTFTVGDCRTFDEVEYSELLFDLMICMMIKTKGNIAKRRKLIELLGKDRVYQILKELERVNEGR